MSDIPGGVVRSATGLRRSPWRSVPLAILAGSVFLGGCAAEQTVAIHGVAPARLMPITIGMSWQGDLPCADCPGIRTTLTLLPDGSYRRDDAYLGTDEPGDTIFGEIGRFTLDRSGERLSLIGSGEGRGQFLALADGNLRMLDSSGEEIDSNLNYTLIHLPNPVPQEGILRVSGHFTYMADAALLLECHSGVQLPVAMESEYLALETDYLERGSAGAPLPVRLTGRVEERPAIDGEGTETTFIVTAHEILEASPDCPAAEIPDQFASGEWELEWVFGDQEGVVVEGFEVPTLTWNAEDLQLSGSSGCNRFSGRSVLRGSLLVSGPIAGTRRFCEGVMDREARILSLFSHELVLRIAGDELTLHRRGEVVAQYRRTGGGG